MITSYYLPNQKDCMLRYDEALKRQREKEARHTKAVQYKIVLI